MHAKVQWYIECTEIIICGRNIWSIDSLFWERSEREPSKWIVVISKLWRVQKNVFAVAIRGVVLWIHFKLYVHCADRKWSRLKLQHLVNSLNQTGLMVIKIPDQPISIMEEIYQIQQISAFRRVLPQVTEWLIEIPKNSIHTWKITIQTCSF